MKILTIGDLKAIRDRAAGKLQLREQSDLATDGRCCGLTPCCNAALCP